METNEKQNICLAEIKKDIEKICEAITRMEKVSEKKLDKEMYNLYLKSQTKRVSEVDAKTDRSWNELVLMKAKDEEFNREIMNEIAEIKKIQAVKISNISYVMVVIAIGATTLATKVWHFIFN